MYPNAFSRLSIPHTKTVSLIYMKNKARCTFEGINTFRPIVFSIPHVTFLNTYFKNFVGENNECQLSNGDCTTEKKYGY